MREDRENLIQEDDGHTIADMSDVPRPSLGWFPSASRERKQASVPQQTSQSDRPWENAPISPKERWMYMLGAMKAALLLGLAYLAGFGVLIFLLLQLWN
jgi:hypothetical protein